jgi:hypothetical protein
LSTCQVCVSLITHTPQPCAEYSANVKWEE